MNTARGWTPSHLQARIRQQLTQYHPTVWLLTVGRLFNSIIQFMAMPFMTMYLSSKGVDLAVIGLIAMVGPIGSTVGNLVSGQLADRYGRKLLMVIGLGFSGLATAGFAFAHETWHFAALMLAQGLFGSCFWPASRAAIADLVPPERRAGAYGMWRITNNIGTAVGPLLGALVTQRSLMFGITGLADMAFALVFLWLGVESLPAAARKVQEIKDKKLLRAQTGREWAQLIGDHAFVLFILAGIFNTISYQQMFGNYSLYLEKFSAHPAQTFSWMLSLNGLMVVFGQAFITHWTRNWTAARQLVVGTMLYALSYAIFAIPGHDALVLFACVVWTVGEMIVMTAQMTFVADIAPEALRGRYMGASSISWTVGALLCGPFGALLMKYFGGGTMMLAATGVTVVAALIYRLSAQKAASRLFKAAAAPVAAPAAN